MIPHSLVVVAVDGLRAAALGAYGNTSFPTPYFDRLASESVVYDQFLGDSADLDQLLTSLWMGSGPLADIAPENRQSLAGSLRAAGFHCHLVTDEPEVAAHPLASDFDEIVIVDSAADEPATSAAETGMGIVLATALEVELDLASRSEPTLLWVQLRGMQGPWDAPPELGLSLRDEEEDPDWEPSLEVPRHVIDRQEGDDQAFIATCRYAGQVMALDECLEGFVNEITAPPRSRECDLLVMGVRGFPLGEHGWVGVAVPYNEQLHVPLCYRRADGTGQLTRLHGLVQPGDVCAWLAQFPQLREPLAPNRPLAISQAAGRVAFASREWRAIADASNQREPEIELYSSADDRWQANNVASLCRNEVDEFAKLCQHLGTGKTEEELLGGFDRAGDGDRSGPGEDA